MQNLLRYPAPTQSFAFGVIKSSHPFDPALHKVDSHNSIYKSQSELAAKLELMAGWLTSIFL
jgi:hypothetical protein